MAAPAFPPANKLSQLASSLMLSCVSTIVTGLLLRVGINTDVGIQTDSMLGTIVNGVLSGKCNSSLNPAFGAAYEASLASLERHCADRGTQIASAEVASLARCIDYMYHAETCLSDYVTMCPPIPPANREDIYHILEEVLGPMGAFRSKLLGEILSTTFIMHFAYHLNSSELFWRAFHNSWIKPINLSELIGRDIAPKWTRFENNVRDESYTYAVLNQLTVERLWSPQWLSRNKPEMFHGDSQLSNLFGAISDDFVPKKIVFEDRDKRGAILYARVSTQLIFRYPQLSRIVSPFPETLNGQQVGKLRDAMLDAFNSETLRQMATINLGIDLEKVTETTTLSSAVFGLIQWAKRTGKVPALLEAIHKEVPESPSVMAFIASLTEPDKGSGTLSEFE